jgi:hypothetical protein
MLAPPRGQIRNHLSQAAQGASPPSRGQIKCLTRIEGDMVMGAGLTDSPVAFFLARLAIITLQA